MHNKQSSKPYATNSQKKTRLSRNKQVKHSLWLCLENWKAKSKTLPANFQNVLLYGLIQSLHALDALKPDAALPAGEMFAAISLSPDKNKYFR